MFILVGCVLFLVSLSVGPTELERDASECVQCLHVSVLKELMYEGENGLDLSQQTSSLFSSL